MVETPVDRALIEAFIEACGDTNFQVIARGTNTSGAVKPTIQKATLWRGENRDKTETKVTAWPNGLRSGVTVDGLTRVFRIAVSLAEGGDWCRAIEALVECGYYQQIELIAKESISVQELYNEQTNPAADLEPLIWRCESGQITTHGGARQGAGKPALLVDPVTLVFKVNRAVAERVKTVAGVRPYAELLREMVEGL